MKYDFSLAASDDIPAIMAIYGSLIGTSGCTWGDDYPCMDNVVNDIASGSLYVIRDGDTIISVAAAGFCDELEDFVWSPKNPCDLARIGVVSDKQNRGIGSLMLQNVIAAVKLRGFDGIRMLVSKTNPHALAMYDKNGFTRLNEVVIFDIDFYRYEMVF